MAIITTVVTNSNTQQSPITSGLTSGNQVIKWIAADRVYIKAADANPAPVVVKSNGTAPAGWTDLGIVNGKVKITYNKEIKEVRTGLDQILRVMYVGKKDATGEAQLSQFDDVVLQEVSGVSASQITAGSVYQFGLGAEDVIQKAILLVSQNKLDGKEWQWYNPAGFVSFQIGDNGEETIVTLTVGLPAFTFGSQEVLFVQSIFK